VSESNALTSNPEMKNARHEDAVRFGFDRE